MAQPPAPHRPACHSCAHAGPTALNCNGAYPCSICRASGTRCSYPRPSTPPSAWTTTPAAAVQRWPESTQLVPGEAAAFRLRAQRDAQGKVEGFRREWAVDQDEDLRVRPRRAKVSLLFPASVDDRGESEAVDLEGDPLSFLTEGQLLLGLHGALPRDPLQPTVYLNSALQDRSVLPSKSRITQKFEPSNLNIGNALAVCDVTLEDSASGSSCVAFRRAAIAGGRATAVGWGSFSPLPKNLRAPTRKGKERAGDSDDRPSPSGFHPCTAPIFENDHPILQLELAALCASSSALLGVRTHNSLDLLHLDLPAPFDPSAPPAVLSRFTYNASLLARRSIADFALGPSPGAGLCVDTSGALFGWGLGERGSGRVGDGEWNGAQPEMFRLRRGRKQDVREYTGMARVQCGGTRGTDALVALEDEVLLYDLRSPKDVVTLVDADLLTQHLPYGSTTPARVVSLLRRTPSSLVAPTAQHIVATSQDILYLDARMPARATLRWKHGRVGPEGKGADLTLSLFELPAPQAPAEGGVTRAALASRLHAQLDFFTTRTDPALAPQAALDAYALPGPRRPADVPLVRGKPTPFVRGGTAFVPLALASVPGAVRDDAMDVDREDDDGTDAAGRRAARLERLAAEARARPAWRLLELGVRGELSMREVVVGDGGEDDEGVGADADAVAASVLYGEDLRALGAEAERVRRGKGSAERRKPGDERMVDVRRARAALAPEKVLAALEAAQARNEVGIERVAGKMMGGAAARQKGDVGALTALELLSLAKEHADAVDEDDGASPAVSVLPRGSPYEEPMLVPSDPRTALDAALAAAPASLHLHRKDPATHFCTLLPRRATAVPVSANASPGERLRAVAAAHVTRSTDLASRVLLPRAIEPDEPTNAPNQPQPPDEEPPALHFSYLRPVPTTLPASGDESDHTRAATRKRGQSKRTKKTKKPVRERVKPSLDGLGPRLLLAEWHVGADPRSYVWHNPYDDDQEKDLDALAVAQSQASASSSSSRRKKRDRALAANSSPAVPAASSASQSYFPLLAPPQLPPAVGSSGTRPQLEEWTRLAATQPTISVSGPADAPSSQAGVPQFGGAASQTVPGAFGSRLTVGRADKDKKKKAKKRVSGF
ncbi:hypothetical protein JCM3770_003531 [Rhodotorula araucariae]